jgi:hypothetical protein
MPLKTYLRERPLDPARLGQTETVRPERGVGQTETVRPERGVGQTGTVRPEFGVGQTGTVRLGTVGFRGAH